MLTLKLTNGSLDLELYDFKGSLDKAKTEIDRGKL
jgi:hypothetical protein